jgi:anti-sigma B factor antagonist
MKITTDNFKGGIIIKLSGDIDLETSPELRTVLLSYINKKTSPIIVDFSDVSYVDSSGIATLVEALKLMKEYVGSLKLTAIPKSVIEIFNFLKLEKVFNIYDDVSSCE